MLLLRNILCCHIHEMYMSYLQWFYILISANPGYRKSQIFSLVWFSYPINFVCVVFWKRNDVGVDFKPKTHKCQFNCNEDRSVSQKFRYTKRNDAVAANFRRPWKDEKPLTMLVPIFNISTILTNLWWETTKKKRYVELCLE